MAILQAIKERFRTAFEADKNGGKVGGIEALNGIKIGNPSGELVELTRQVVMGSLLLGRVQAQDGIALADDDFTVSFDEKSVPFNEAVEYLKSLISIPKKEWEKLERCVQFRAFTVAALAEADGIEKVRASLTKAVEEGSPIWESWPEIEALTERLGNRFAPGYWETVYRTNAQTAYNAGRLMQYKDNWPPAWELLFIQDKRQSDTCKDLAHLVGGKAIPSDHHFWKTYGFSPYHFNCRTTFRAVYDYEMKGGEIAVVRPSKKALEENFAVQEGFGGNPLEKESWWKLTDNMVKRAMKYGILEQVQAFGEKYGVDMGDFKATVAKVRKKITIQYGFNNLPDPIFDDCEQKRIKYNQIQKADKKRTIAKIVDDIAGGDQTRGSCSSVAFAYIGCKQGYIVNDFRGGRSSQFFADYNNILRIAKTKGVEYFTESGYNDFRMAEALFQNLKQNKEYYFAIGKHAAIIKKNSRGLQYLELQNPDQKNGFKTLNDNSLKSRFKCSPYYSNKQYAILIDADSLGKTNLFKKLLGYINTATDQQKKGATGGIK